jgi:hypothetical protein
VTTYPIRRQQRHPDRNPTPLTRPQHKPLLYPQRLHNLQIHKRRVPVRPLLVPAIHSRAAVAEEFDGEKVHGVGEATVGVLAGVEVGVCGEGVDEDEGWFGGVVGLGHLVGGGYAAQVGDLDGFSGARHFDGDYHSL